MAKPKQPSSWRDRIIGFERIPAKELQSHAGNWRTHPQFQQDALLGTLREIGIAGALLVYRSPAQDGALVTIDGHLRKGIDPEQDWPCLVLDVDDEEAAYILATHDPLASFAQANTEQLQRLLGSVQSGEQGVQALLSQLAENHGLYPDAPPRLSDLEEQYGAPDEAAFYQTITVRVSPAVYERYQSVLKTFPGEDDAARFAALLEAVAS